MPVAILAISVPAVVTILRMVITSEAVHHKSITAPTHGPEGRFATLALRKVKAVLFISLGDRGCLHTVAGRFKIEARTRRF